MSLKANCQSCKTADYSEYLPKIIEGPIRDIISEIELGNFSDCMRLHLP